MHLLVNIAHGTAHLKLHIELGSETYPRRIRDPTSTSDADNNTWCGSRKNRAPPTKVREVRSSSQKRAEERLDRGTIYQALPNLKRYPTHHKSIYACRTGEYIALAITIQNNCTSATRPC